MAKYRSVHVKVWSDPWFTNLPPTAQHIFLYLITNEHRTESGLYPISLKTISNETNHPIETIQGAMKDLQPKVQYDEQAQVVWIVNAVKHLGLRFDNQKDKRFISICKDLDYNNTPLTAQFLEKYPEFRSPLQGPSKGGGPPTLSNKDYGLRIKDSGLRTKEQKGVFAQEILAMWITCRRKVAKIGGKQTQQADLPAALALVDNFDVDDAKTAIQNYHWLAERRDNYRFLPFADTLTEFVEKGLVEKCLDREAAERRFTGQGEKGEEASVEELIEIERRRREKA